MIRSDLPSRMHVMLEPLRFQDVLGAALVALLTGFVVVALLLVM